MKRILLLLSLFLSLTVSAQYFVAVNGNDNNSGTFNEPWGTLNKAFISTKPGDTVYIRGGVYYSTERIGMQGWTAPRWFTYYTRSGVPDSNIVYMGYPPDVEQGDIPILDCSQHCENMHKTGYNYFKYKIDKSPYNVKYNSAIVLVGVEYVTLKDFKVRNVYQCDGMLSAAITVIGNNITYENISIENADIGFHHISTSMSLTDLTYMRDNNLWCTNHEYHMLFNQIISRTLERPLVGPDTLLPAYWNDTIFNRQPDSSSWKNCDVSYICDTLSFTHHDKYHYYIFEGDTLYATKLYSQFNDFIIADTGVFGDAWKVQSFNGNYLKFEGCRAWNYSGDGFDVRGGKILFENCWAMPTSIYNQFNLGDGFVTSTFNSDLMAYYTTAYREELLQDTMVEYRNCLAMFCARDGFRHGIEGDISNNPIFLNNTSYQNGVGFSSKVTGADTIGDIYHNNIAYDSDTNINISAVYTESHNTWNSTLTVTDNDFIDVDYAAIIALFAAPRNPDHTLPDSTPLMLAIGSNLINEGIDVGIDYNGMAPDLGYFESDYGEVNQNIDLLMGWNIASFYVEPSDWNMLYVVNPLISDSTLVKVQNSGGDFIQNIQPYGWLNTIGDMSNKEGYYIYVNDTTNFNISGDLVGLPYNVELSTGWNMLGYPLTVNQNALTVLESLINDTTLIKVMSETGDFIQYIPPYGWLNTIGNFKPDEGYLIKLTSPDTVSYNIGVKSIAQTEPVKLKTSCFGYFENNPYMPMNVLIKKIIPRWFKMESGDELSVYDEDVLVGSTVITNPKEIQNIVARMDDPTTPEQDGFITGNEILFKYCDKSENNIYETVIAKHHWGDTTFIGLGTYLGRLRVLGNKTKDMVNLPEDMGFYLDQNYPNPFTTTTIIEYGIPYDGNVLLTVFDISGRRVYVIEDTYKSAGDYTIFFGGLIDSGLYFYKLEFYNDDVIFTETKKMMVR